MIHFFIGQKSNIKKLDRKCIVRHHKWVIFVVLGLKYVDAFLLCIDEFIFVFLFFIYTTVYMSISHDWNTHECCGFIKNNNLNYLYMTIPRMSKIF